MAYLWAAVLVVACVLTGVLGNNRLVTTTYRAALPGLRTPLRVVHLSDLHGKRFGRRDDRLLSAVRDLKPDLIAFSGDLLCKGRDVTVRAIEQIRVLSEIAPVAVCRGNHDLDPAQWSGLSQGLLTEVRHDQVYVLRNEVIEFAIGENVLTLAGVDDPAAYDEEHELFLKALGELSDRASQLSQPRILLSHRPEFIDRYAATSFQLSLSGHAHGGQIRLPLVGALWAPKQGVLPRHSDGIHHIGSLTAVVSRGLGSSSFPPRFLNPPEIVAIDCAVEVVTCTSAPTRCRSDQ